MKTRRNKSLDLVTNKTGVENVSESDNEPTSKSKINKNVYIYDLNLCICRLPMIMTVLGLFFEFIQRHFLVKLKKDALYNNLCFPS